MEQQTALLNDHNLAVGARVRMAFSGYCGVVMPFRTGPAQPVTEPMVKVCWDKSDIVTWWPVSKLLAA